MYYHNHDIFTFPWNYPRLVSQTSSLKIIKKIWTEIKTPNFEDARLADCVHALIIYVLMLWYLNSKTADLEETTLSFNIQYDLNHTMKNKLEKR